MTTSVWGGANNNFLKIFAGRDVILLLSDELGHVEKSV